MDVGTIPDGLRVVRTTPSFTASTVPDGLRRAHRIADEVWGRVVVTQGSLGFVFEDTPDEPIVLVAGDTLVIPPGRLHHVETDAPVAFVIEFHTA